MRHACGPCPRLCSSLVAYQDYVCYGLHVVSRVRADTPFTNGKSFTAAIEEKQRSVQLGAGAELLRSSAPLPFSKMARTATAPPAVAAGAWLPLRHAQAVAVVRRFYAAIDQNPATAGGVSDLRKLVGVVMHVGCLEPVVPCGLPVRSQGG